MHAIVILNHRLGKLDPRSTESLPRAGGWFGEGEVQRQNKAIGAGGTSDLTRLGVQFREAREMS